jgi:NadR type nicotinamide-nucleotide adenylyltransferase
MKKFAITGPESSGKTTLSIELANQFNGIHVPEFAREFLTKTNCIYSESDLDTMAQAQVESWNLQTDTEIVFCDTDMLVFKVWSEYKFGRISTFILEALELQNFDHYFLCRPDIPWEEDPLREHPEARNELFEIYLKEIKRRNYPYTIIEGDLEQRLKLCKEIIRPY